MEKSLKKLSPRMIIAIAVAVVIVLVGSTFAISRQVKKGSKGAEIITVSTLEKIINVSELSTFTAVYNGIAEVMNEKEPTELDYYVSYEAKVNTGINFEDTVIAVDKEAKEIRITIPDVKITEINVDIASLDYIFYNDKANTSSVTEQAYKACEADAESESEKQGAIFELAKQNAVNVLTALTKPIVEQLDEDYMLVVE